MQTPLCAPQTASRWSPRASPPSARGSSPRSSRGRRRRRAARGAGGRRDGAPTACAALTRTAPPPPPPAGVHPQRARARLPRSGEALPRRERQGGRGVQGVGGRRRGAPVGPPTPHHTTPHHTTRPLRRPRLTLGRSMRSTHRQTTCARRCGTGVCGGFLPAACSARAYAPPPGPLGTLNPLPRCGAAWSARPGSNSWQPSSPSERRREA